MSKGVCTKESLVSVFPQSPKRVVVIHGDLFKDHALLFIKVSLSQCRTEDVRNDGSGIHQFLGKDMGVKRRQLPSGESIVTGTNTVEITIDIVGGPALSPLEHHVLKEVADTHQLPRLITGASFHKEPHRRGVRLGAGFSNYRQTIVEHCVPKFKSHKVAS